MNVPNSKQQTARLTGRQRFLFFLVPAALLLRSAPVFADTCPNVDPQPVPQETPAPAYQPHIYDPTDNTTLRRLRFAPSTTGIRPC